jgi:hypothetical protein
MPEKCHNRTHAVQQRTSVAVGADCRRGSSSVAPNTPLPQRVMDGPTADIANSAKSASLLSACLAFQTSDLLIEPC